MQEIRSVCSCTCNSCNPFQQVNRREMDINPLDQDNNEFNTNRADEMGDLRCSTTMRWYSTESLRTTSPGRAMTMDPNSPDLEYGKQLVWMAKKAISVHDLHRAEALRECLSPTSPDSMANEVLLDDDLSLIRI